MKLIDKSALVAEIEKLLDKGKCHEEYDCGYRDGRNGVLYELQGKLDTLEVKEYREEYDGFLGKELKMVDDEIERLEKLKVKEGDLEKEITLMEEKYYGFESLSRADIIEIIKHFFELGMQVSNKSQNVWHNADEKLPSGVIVVNNYGHLHIGWATDEGDGIEDEHGCLITKTYQKWTREKDLT